MVIVAQRARAFSAVIIVLFVRFGSGTTMGLSSRTEWLSLRELRSSLGIKGKYWPIKTAPCRNWTGIQCRDGSVVGISVSGLRRTRKGRLNPSFAVESLVNFKQLESFNASGFLLNGSIPEWFGESNKLGALQVLDLRSCSITGSIPESIGGLSVLKSLLLSGNSLTGRMPLNLVSLSKLSELDLSGNSLSGPVPNSLSSLVNLTKLDLSSNFLSESIPPEFGNLPSLQVLNLSNNALIGFVPSQIGNLSKLVELDLGKNSLSGFLSDGLFSGLLKLRVLVLSWNDFGGALPAALWLLPGLSFVDVSSNNFTGFLPEFSGSNVSSAGLTLNLSNNFFYGTLNISLKKFKMIDLSGNYLEGKVQESGLSITLARNCLQMVSNQRGVGDCRMFYDQRDLPFAGGVRSKSRENKRWIFILAGVFGGFGLILLLVLFLILLLKLCDSHKNLVVQRGTESQGPVLKADSSTPPLPKDPYFAAGVGEAFTFVQMLHFTENFAEANIIKHGHSGDLFWGVLEGGVTVVVKKVDLNVFKRESYIAELRLLSKFSHARLVPILGHCLENENEKCVVYKYMPNGDLASSLHRVTGEDGKLKSLDWITRLKIALGAAEGLAYLHECNPPVIHRDVRASSILLDDKFEVRLGSLSEVTTLGDNHQGVLSRIFSKPSSSNQVNLGTSSVTCADDVYCFGKILLELVTGNIDVSKSDDAASREWIEQTLPYITLYDKERIHKIVDPSLIVDEDLLDEVWAMAIVARSCLNPRPLKRPPMRHVLKALENPLKVVREESASSVKLRTTSSRRSWSIGLFGSWRQNSSDSTTTTNKEGTSGTRKSGKMSSQGSGVNDHSSSNKRSSNEVFPEPLEIQDLEAGEIR